MTAILYVKDDGIYSDHLFVDTDNVYNHPNKNYAHKVFRSENDQFIYALSGRWIFEHDTNRDRIEKALHEFLIKNDNVVRTPNLPGEGLPLNNSKLATGTLFILTLEKLFVIDFDSGLAYAHPHINDEFKYYGIGSGGLVAEAVLRLSGDPNAAIKHCSTVLFSCGLSEEINNGEPDYQPQNMLKPLVKSDPMSDLNTHNQSK